MPRGGTRVCLAAVLGLAAAAVFAAPASAGYYYPSHSFAAPDVEQTSADQGCDEAGHEPIGGGASGFDGYTEGLHFNTSRPYLFDGTTPGWTVWVDNYPGGGLSPSPTVYVVCDDNPKPDQYTIRQTQVTVDDDTSRGATAKCRANETVVGGGGRSNGFYTDQTYLATSAPADGKDGDKAPDDGWRAVLSNDEGGAGSNTLDVFAICDARHGKRFFTYVRETRGIPDGTQKTEPAFCGERELIGGGVESHSPHAAGLYIAGTHPFTLGGQGDVWFGVVVNYDTPDDELRKITTTAICKR